MKTKTHWLRNTLLVVTACGIAGLILGVFIFRGEGQKTYATASLQFSFDGAGEGIGPNGYAFTTDGIFEEEVISAALQASDLEGIYTADQIRDSLEVIGVYPENIVNQMTKYTSLLDSNADQQAAVTEYYATIFDVTLYNSFDPYISAGKLTDLLKNLLTAYREYFSRTCSANLKKDDPLKELEKYDYVQRLTALRGDTAQLSRYAQKMSELASDFRQEQDGKGFDDIRIRYDNLDSELKRLYASVTLNALSVDAERLRKQYVSEMLDLEQEKVAKQEELIQVEKLAESYKKDSIVYVSTTQSMVKVSGNTTETYDLLAAKREELTKKLLNIQERMVTLEDLLSDLNENSKAAETDMGSLFGETAEETAVQPVKTVLSAEERERLTENILRKMTAAVEKKNTVTDDFVAMLSSYTAREINEETVSVTELKYKTPSLLSGAYLKTAVKTAGPLCALGFMVCVILLIRSRRREVKLGMK